LNFNDIFNKHAVNICIIWIGLNALCELKIFLIILDFFTIIQNHLKKIRHVQRFEPGPKAKTISNGACTANRASYQRHHWQVSIILALKDLKPTTNHFTNITCTLLHTVQLKKKKPITKKHPASLLHSISC